MNGIVFINFTLNMNTINIYISDLQLDLNHELDLKKGRYYGLKR